MSQQAPALPVPPLTEEQKADYNPEFVLIDPRPISAERWREIAKWHDTFHPVAQEDLPLEEEWQRVNDLINALADSDQGLEYAARRVYETEKYYKAEVARLSRLLEEERRTHKVQVLDILRDMRLPLLELPAPYGPGGDLNYGHDYVKGQNKERQATNDYCRQKAYEYDRQGIGPDPTEVGQWDTLPKTEPAAPTCQRDCQRDCQSPIVARVTLPADAPPLTPELGAALTEMIQLAHKQVSQPDGTAK